MADFAGARAGSSRQAPQHAFLIAGKLLRLLSVYSLFRCLASSPELSVVVLMFFCLLASAGIFLALQRPWVGRPLFSSHIIPTAVNGVVLALSLITWGKSLAACGPVRTVLAEYTGAALGATSTLALGRGGSKLKKAGGLAAMFLAFLLLFKGWTMASLSPFSHSSSSTSGEPGPASITLSFISGSLLALRRIVARRVSTKSYMKKRLHSISVAAGACFLFPFAMFQLSFAKSLSTDTGAEARGGSSLTWACLTTIVFGIVLGFYVDTYSEDRLHIHPTSPLHFLITSALLILLEFFYGMDFSFVGFIICASILGLGIFECTSTSSSPESSGVLPTDSSPSTS